MSMYVYIYIYTHIYIYICKLLFLQLCFSVSDLSLDSLNPLILRRLIRMPQTVTP